MSKRYYWLKLNSDFFRDKKIKKLRRLAGGDTLTIIYLKLQLLTLNTDGIYKFENVEDDIYEELALELDEDEDNIKMLLLYLQSNGMVELNENSDVAIPYVIENLGSESASAARVRKHRKQKNALALQCNTEETSCNIEKEKEKSREEKDEEIELEKSREEIVKVLENEGIVLSSMDLTLIQNWNITVEDFKTKVLLPALQQKKLNIRYMNGIYKNIEDDSK